MMRRVIAAALLIVLTASPALPVPLTADERQRLLAHLAMTEGWLVDETAGLTTDQLRFRPTPDSWSVLDVVEHLAIAEPQYWQHLKESLQAPAANVKPEATDAGILWYGVDRTNRQRTGEPRVPRGRWRTVEPPLQEFRALRGVMREYAASTTDDLRGRMLKDGNMDVYQWFLMISTHAQRHILQIREIKGHGAFPKGKG